jgi:hypothetical protein
MSIDSIIQTNFESDKVLANYTVLQNVRKQYRATYLSTNVFILRFRPEGVAEKSQIFF